jgi:hypothetical protein
MKVFLSSGFVSRSATLFLLPTLQGFMVLVAVRSFMIVLYSSSLMVSQDWLHVLW